VNRKVRLIFLVFGVVMVVNALVMEHVIPGIPFALLIIGGLLLVWAGYGARIKRIP